ncbi:MAG: ferritin-like domain-containing protein [Acidimicrobiales bacterium]
MERVIATYHHKGHELDVVESIDEDEVTVRFVVDGELLQVDAHPDRVPTEEEAISLLASWQGGTGTDSAPARVANRSVLRPREVIALLDALDDEHRAHATYAQVIADFGEVRPFVNIVESEGRHIAALERLMQRYEVPVPTNPWPGKVTRYESVAQACADAIDAEIENAALYDRLLAAIERPDIREVLHNLREASQQRHLPAFQRCAQRDRGDDDHHQGRGRHRHRGHT